MIRAEATDLSYRAGPRRFWRISSLARSTPAAKRSAFRDSSKACATFDSSAAGCSIKSCCRFVSNPSPWRSIRNPTAPAAIAGLGV